MRHHILLTSLAALLLGHSAVHAQMVPPLMGGGVGPMGPMNPMNRPVLSPYLNIVGGGNPAINFYNQTNWQFDQRAFDQRLLNQAAPTMGSPQGDLNSLIPSLPQSGHMVSFQYYTPYFGAGVQRNTYFPFNPSGTSYGGAGTTGGAGATRGGGTAAGGVRVPPGAGPMRR
jgi:hypothetical protein